MISDDVARACFPSKGPATADDPRFHRNRLRGVLQGVSGALAVIAWALGASLVGAEFASRSMTTLLTWETRRGRVFVAKAVAAVAALTVFALLVLVLVSLAMWPALALHGAPAAAERPLAGDDRRHVIARGVALSALAAAMGFAIATIGRNTAAALGAGFAYIIVLENILGSSIARWRRWLLLGNVIVFVSGHDNAGDVTGRTRHRGRHLPDRGGRDPAGRRPPAPSTGATSPDVMRAGADRPICSRPSGREAAVRRGDQPATIAAASAVRWSFVHGGPSVDRGPCRTSSARSPNVLTA